MRTQPTQGRLDPEICTEPGPVEGSGLKDLTEEVDGETGDWGVLTLGKYSGTHIQPQIGEREVTLSWETPISDTSPI